MLRKNIDRDGVISLKSISSEKDLKIKGRFNINPPPEHGRCECCGKHISELKPFKDIKHPIFGYVKSAILVKNFRIMILFDDGEEKDWQCVKNFAEGINEQLNISFDNILKVKSKCTNGKWDFYLETSNHLVSSWECRDCIDLCDEEYFQIKYRYVFGKIYKR